MVMVGNDGFNVVARTVTVRATDPEWQTEYARRAAVVMRDSARTASAAVYWLPPPTARDGAFNRIYQTQNRAIGRPPRRVPGVRYVDIYARSRRPLQRRAQDRRPEGAGAAVRRRAFLARGRDRSHPARVQGDGPRTTGMLENGDAAP